MYRLALLVWLLVQATAPPVESPKLQIEAPPEFAALRTRLESLDPRQLADIVQLLALTDAGPAIKVVLANENSDLARQVSPWIAGFALSATDTVVIFPVRSPSYPNDTFDDVLRHEVAHVLIERASAGQPIPRWFNEGLAMAVERGWRFEDQTQLLYQLVLGSRTGVRELDSLFGGNQSDQTRAYALAGALVRDVLERHGTKTPGEILTRVRRGAPFDAAFAEVTGMTPDDADSEFWRGQRVWTAWAPILTSVATVWMAVTLLALLAFYRRRLRNIKIEREWAKEEEESRDRTNAQFPMLNDHPKRMKPPSESPSDDN